IGVPGRMRTVRSLLRIFAVFPQAFASVHVFNKQPDADDAALVEELRAQGLNVQTGEDFDALLPTLDVVYINTIAWVGDGFETWGSEYRLIPELPFKDEAIVLHPLARGEELSTELDHTPRNWYFAQARGAVFLRMALL